MTHPLSRIQQPRVPEDDIDDAFSDELYSRKALENAGARGPTLDAMLLTDMAPDGADEKRSSREQISASPAGTAETTAASTAETEVFTGHQSQTENPVHDVRAAAIHSNVPTRRLTWQGRPSVRLQLIGEHELQKRPSGYADRLERQMARCRQHLHRSLST